MSFWKKVKGFLGRVGKGIIKTAPIIGGAVGSLIPGLGTTTGTLIGTDRKSVV